MTTTAEENGHAATALAKMSTDIAGMDVRTLATVLVKSGYFQDTRELSQAVVKVLAGRELGFGPIASMQGVYIVKGRVSLASNLIAAGIQRSGRFRYRVAKLDRSGCVIKFYERFGNGWEEIGEATFDPKDAADAGLANGENYKHFPRNMYFARALTNGARWYCPEVFNGPVYTPDELGATVDDDGVVIDIPSAPPMDTDETAKLSKRYAEIFPPNYGEDTQAVEARPSTTEEPADSASLPEPAATPTRPTIAGDSPTRAELWSQHRRLQNKATELGLPTKTLSNRVFDDEIAAANRELMDGISMAEAAL